MLAKKFVKSNVYVPGIGGVIFDSFNYDGVLNVKGKTVDGSKDVYLKLYRDGVFEIKTRENDQAWQTEPLSYGDVKIFDLFIDDLLS